MPEEAFVSLVGDWGPAGLLALYIIATLTGRLIPRRTLNDVIHDRDEWRSESRLRDQEIAEKNEQLRHMAEVGGLMKQVLAAVKHTHKERPAEDEQ